MSNLPPYNITFTPSSGTGLTSTDITTTISNYDGFAKARYFFIQLELSNNSVMHYAEIEIYDENGINIALNRTVVQSSMTLPAGLAIDGNITTHHQTDSGSHEWLGIDLSSNGITDQQIAGIRVYGQNHYRVAPGGDLYARTAPFRIFLYKDADYTGTGTFANGGTGPLDYNNYQLRSSDATSSPVINGNQQVFYYGITANIGTSSNQVTYFPYSLYSNNVIVDIDKTFYNPKLPQYNITLTPSSGTELNTSDITSAISTYNFAEARYFFIQLETQYKHMHYAEIEIYDETGTNIALNKTAVQSSIYNNEYASHAIDGNITNYHHTGESAGNREWWGIDLNTNQKIAGIRVYGRADAAAGFAPGGTYYSRTAPFRIFLYKDADYTGTGTFADGPLDYNNYQLHSNTATKSPVINGNQQVFYFNGINAQIGTFSNQVTYIPYSLSYLTNIDKTFYNPNLPPYNITFTPSSGTELTEIDINSTIAIYDGFAEARYVFIQLETENTMLVYNEIEIYDPSGTNIALNVTQVIQSSFHNSTSYPATHGTDGDLVTGNIWTTDNPGERSWWGIDLGSDKTIAGIRVYGHDNTTYIPGGSTYTRTAPFRIFFYKDADYTGTFDDGTASPAGTGPLDYNNYQLHSSDVTKTELINGNQIVFYYGITAQIGSDISNVTRFDISNNAIANIEYIDNLPPYNITFTPFSGTELTASDITNTLTNYKFALARYFFIQLETSNQYMNYAEIEIYDETGTNIALNKTVKQSSIHGSFSVSNATNGDLADFQHTLSESGRREWLGIDLSDDNIKNQKIAGIRVYGRADSAAGFAPGGTHYSRTAPFRIFLYKSSDYTGIFADGTATPAGTGPLDYNNYQLHSNDATNSQIINGDQQVFYYGINAQIGSDISNVTSFDISNNAIANIDKTFYVRNLPPYNITFTPSSGTDLTATDISNTLSNYNFVEARYVFIQLETEDQYMNYAEIEIYDPSGNNIAPNGDARQSSTNSSYMANIAIDGNIDNFHHTHINSNNINNREWLGIDLDDGFGTSNHKIAGIRVYGCSGEFGTGAYASRTYPFRIFLYTNEDYTSSFQDAGTGPLDYTNYQLHSSDVTKTELINGNQIVFYYGITAKIGSDISNVTYFPYSLYSNNAILDIDKTFYVRNLQPYPYNITFTPSTGTELTTIDINTTLSNYDGFAEARYVFIQLETQNTMLVYNEIEIYDEYGTNIALNVTQVIQSSFHDSTSYPATDGTDGNLVTGNIWTTDNPGERSWWGINLGSDKTIAGIHVYGHDNTTYIPGGSTYTRTAPFRIFLYKDADYTGIFANGNANPAGTGPLDYDNYQLHSSDATRAPVINENQQVFYYGINAQIGSDISNVTSIPDSLYSNNAILDIDKTFYYNGMGNYYHMDVSMHYSNLSYGVYLPTVTFTTTDENGIFTSTMRTTQLAEQGFTGFYEADFASDIYVIDSEAFEGDDKVCVATINQVTDICGNAFKNCPNLRAVTLDTAVDSNNSYKIKNIHSGVFEGCTALKQLYIPDTVTTIDASLCAGCTNLEVAVMGYGIPRPAAGGGSDVSGIIGANAFDGCSKLQYFIVPDTVSDVSDNAFKGCSSLEHVLIGETIQSIADNAFTNISSSCTVTLPNDTSIPDTLFNSSIPVESFRRYTVYTIGGTSGSITHNSMSGVPTNVGYWKAKINNGVTTVSDNTFRDTYIWQGSKYSNLVAISIPSSVTSWGADVIYNGNSKQSNLLSLYFPKDLRFVNTYAAAFYTGTTKTILLQHVCESGRSTNILLNTNTSINNNAFTRNYNLRALILPYNFDKAAHAMAYDCSKLQLVNIFQKNAATTFHNFYNTYAFGGSTTALAPKLEEVYLPELTTWSNYSFFNNSVLKRLHIYKHTNQATTSHISRVNNDTNKFHIYSDDTDTSVPEKTNTYSVNWNNHLIFTKTFTSIPISKFSGHIYLKSLTFEHGGTSPLDIKRNAFTGCQGITDGANHIKWNDREFTFSSTPHSNDNNGIFEDCTNLTSFFIPKRFRCVPSRFLCQCTNLEDLYWDKDSSVTTIYNASFNGTKISNFHIPASVVSIIGDHTFAMNDSLTKITFGAGSRLKHIDGFGHTTDSANNGIINLSKIVLPNSIKSAADRTFNNTFKYGTLDTMVIPSSMEYIPEMFINVYNDGTNNSKSLINTIYIPNSITNVAGPRRHHGYQIQGYDSGTNKRVIRSIHATKYYAPSHLNPLNTTSFTNAIDITYYDFVNFPGTNGIANNLYYQGYYHAEIEEGVTTVGDITPHQETWIPSNFTLENDFNTTMISVNFPRSVKTIASNAFKNCAGLTYVTFHEDSQLTNIQSGAFRQCKNIYDIALPESVTTIGENAFRDCVKLATVKIPYNVSTISAGAFQNCNDLEYVSISDTLYNDISNNMGSYFSSNYNITYHVVPTIEFTPNTGSELTSSAVTEQLRNKGLYAGSIYQPTFASSVSIINPEVYANFPEFTLYTRGFPKRFKTDGPYASIVNGTINPLSVGAYLKDGSSTNTKDLPLFKSVPDLNLYNVSNSVIFNDDDNMYLVMPGYSVVIFNNLYDEINTGSSEIRITQVLDNSNGLKPKYFTITNPSETSSILLFYLSKLIHYKTYK